MRIGTWNLNSRRPGRSDHSRMRSLLAAQDLDVLLLQEVYRSDVAALRDLYDASLCSLDVARSDGNVSGKVGTAVLTRRNVMLVGDGELVYGLHQPERGLVAEASCGGRSITLMSWHAPNTAQHGRDRKAQAFQAMLDVMSRNTGVGVIGMDTNFPGEDDGSPTDADWRFHLDLLGRDAGHGWRDLALQAQPTGTPLPATHLAGGVPVRFDRLLGHRVRATHVTTFYLEGAAAGSDHALVVGDVEFADGA